MDKLINDVNSIPFTSVCMDGINTDSILGCLTLSKDFNELLGEAAALGMKIELIPTLEVENEKIKILSFKIMLSHT